MHYGSRTITTSLLVFASMVAPACGGDDGGGTATVADASGNTMTASADTSSGSDPSAGTTTAGSASASTTIATEGTGTTDETSATATSGSATSTTDATGSESTGDATGNGSSGSETAGECAPSQASCLELPCCGALECCSGVPIPDGEAQCLAQCPDSDRNRKRDFRAVDPADVLERVASLPITTWQYDTEPGVRHMGPMAQDFKAAFDLGASDRAIAKVDGDGVALAAVQALHRELGTLRAENETLREELAAMRDRLDRLDRRTGRP